jgi:hypothetical protein
MRGKRRPRGGPPADFDRTVRSGAARRPTARLPASRLTRARPGHHRTGPRRGFCRGVLGPRGGPPDAGRNSSDREDAAAPGGIGASSRPSAAVPKSASRATRSGWRAAKRSMPGPASPAARNATGSVPRKAASRSASASSPVGERSMPERSDRPKPGRSQRTTVKCRARRWTSRVGTPHGRLGGDRRLDRLLRRGRGTPIGPAIRPWDDLHGVSLRPRAVGHRRTSAAGGARAIARSADCCANCAR